MLIVLADHAAPNGTGTRPSWARIAAASGVSRRTVARVSESLEARGLILRGDQEIAAERLHAAGKDVRYAPVRLSGPWSWTGSTATGHTLDCLL